MASMSEGISKIAMYFKGMEYVDDLAFIKVQYKPGWKVFKPKNGIINVAADEDAKNVYFYYGKKTLDLDAFFDLIERTIQYNEQQEEKLVLLNEKIEEMKEIFKKNSIEDLKGLTFQLKKKRTPNSRVEKRVSAKKVKEQMAVQTESPTLENDTPKETPNLESRVDSPVEEKKETPPNKGGRKTKKTKTEMEDEEIEKKMNETAEQTPSPLLSAQPVNNGKLESRLEL